MAGPPVDVTAPNRSPLIEIAHPHSYNSLSTSDRGLSVRWLAITGKRASATPCNIMALFSDSAPCPKQVLETSIQK